MVATEEEYFECNHFQSWENDWDIYHADWTHRQGEIHGPTSGPGRHAFYMSMLRSSVFAETEYGVTPEMEVPGGMWNISVLLMPSTVRLYIPTFNEENRRGAGPQFRDTYITHSAHDDFTHSAFLTQLVPVTGEDAERYRKHHEEVMAMRKTLPSSAQAGREILTGKAKLSDFRQHPVFVGHRGHVRAGWPGRHRGPHERNAGHIRCRRHFPPPTDGARADPVCRRPTHEGLADRLANAAHRHCALTVRIDQGCKLNNTKTERKRFFFKTRTKKIL